ncbi:alpha/beta hydrolase [Demequina capsici]|uniref:Alpha/beta hydrolase n=1 Tax=Demequina capsici TaxID=3075620 RepID=A0AA96F5W3_9MICO|nr:alpha/beta hydrolase [Demequina sp. OYTSA14]WNM23335.1 alpha/beta hydrolase [Demequina sp. OYTSA14]
MTDPQKESTPAWLLWTERALAAAALFVVAWVLATSWGGIMHSHPAYLLLLIGTVLVAVVVGVATLLWRRRSHRGWRRILRIIGAVVGLGWIALIAWLCPFSAMEPALTAMESDDAVTVTETPTLITFAPSSGASDVALAFEPGARVDPRAYAAVLRPLAEAGHTVVIIKQPLGIGFLALGSFDAAKEQDPTATWAIGGHSLGGTVAAMEAENAADTPVGLLFYASYPAGDMSAFPGSVLSISGSNDGLATPAKIEASVADLPGTAKFIVIQGGTHAQFGAYGAQPGDGAPTITADDAREQITAHTLDWLDSLAPSR